MRKVCVYAICKNEMKFVDKWLNSMSEADYVVVLDTGSTDGTYEFLKNDPRVTRVEQKVINPWRFDVARNESMKLVPKDAEILVCTDFDELLIPGWCNAVKRNMTEEFTRLHYLYAWSHNEHGDPALVFLYDKIHTKDYHWIYPVHEVLTINDGCKENGIKIEDVIMLHHYPDNTKPRPYFDLLEVRCQENPNDLLSLYLLAREYGSAGQIEKALEIFLKVEQHPQLNMAPVVECATLGLIGDCYKLMGNHEKTIEYYTRCCVKFPKHREAFLSMAEYFNSREEYGLAYELVKYALKHSVREHDWAEHENSWLEKPYDILSVACYYLGKIDEGIFYAQQALKFVPNEERINKNYQALLLKKKEEEGKWLL